METNVNSPIQGPLTVTLHDDGVDYFMQKGQRLFKQNLFDGTQAYGLTFPKSEAKGLQRMAVLGYINRIEHPVSNIAYERANLIDLTKLLGYGMLYRQFDSRVWDILLNSDLTNAWNRQYPKLAISFGVDTRKLGLTPVLQANESAITAFKQTILRAMQGLIMQNGKLLEEEKRKQMFLAIRFINMVDPFVWLLLTVFNQHPSARNLLGEIQQLLVSYLTKTEAPEYLALMLIELVLIVGNIQASGIEGEEVMGHESVFLSYEISSRKREQGERTRLRITLAQQQSDFEMLRDEVESKKHINLREKSLDAFFERSSTNDAVSNREIGMYYLSYLKDACRRMNISFESFVNVIPGSNQTMMNLVMTF
ncbi:hypothetical protein [Spirochaeta lutea]|uniref:Uncharacterized protein n=1 Tax=Spirochaeta lutea TaxID=1480694 RepID=A0A098QVX0_9SPIO|nr:hypothetical protein [Spirochaeta lutea]KGE71558.1 hypothetical protein DC28_09700 [Spirochaeta lutea]